MSRGGWEDPRKPEKESKDAPGGAPRASPRQRNERDTFGPSTPSPRVEASAAHAGRLTDSGDERESSGQTTSRSSGGGGSADASERLGSEDVERSTIDLRSVDPDRDRSPDRLPAEHLALPRGERREVVTLRGRAYRLRGSESDLLSTVGAFRVVPEADLQRDLPSGDHLAGDLRNLSEQGLIERKQIVIGDKPSPVLVLTREAKALLDAHQEPRPDGRRQEYHAGLVKPRELAHDAQLYRMFRAEAPRIAGEGGRARRVVLDYELKRDYQKHLNRPRNGESGTEAEERTAFAAKSDLSVVNGRLELPDLRIEYETPDGRFEHRDLELVTEHYSRAQIAGKARAGFSMYRAAGSRFGRGGGSGQGGSPSDPHHLEWLR